MSVCSARSELNAGLIVNTFLKKAERWFVGVGFISFSEIRPNIAERLNTEYVTPTRNG